MTRTICETQLVQLQLEINQCVNIVTKAKKDLKQKKKGVTHVWSFGWVLALNNIPQHIDGGIRLNGDTRLHTLLVDITNQLLGASPSGSFFIGRFGRGDRGNSRLIVEAVKIATGLLKLSDPFMRLTRSEVWSARRPHDVPE